MFCIVLCLSKALVYSQIRLISSTNINMNDYVHLSYKDEIAVVKIDAKSSKVNTLSREMLPEFITVFDEISKNDAIKGILLNKFKNEVFRLDKFLTNI
jgi:hypothetical protein